VPGRTPPLLVTEEALDAKKGLTTPTSAVKTLVG
jgi:hypothetical protein